MPWVECATSIVDCAMSIGEYQLYDVNYTMSIVKRQLSMSN